MRTPQVDKEKVATIIAKALKKREEGDDDDEDGDDNDGRTSRRDENTNTSGDSNYGKY